MRYLNSCLQSEASDSAYFFKIKLQQPTLSFTGLESQMSWKDHEENIHIFQFMPQRQDEKGKSQTDS